MIGPQAQTPRLTLLLKYRSSCCFSMAFSARRFASFLSATLSIVNYFVPPLFARTPPYCRCDTSPLPVFSMPFMAGSFKRASTRATAIPLRHPHKCLRLEQLGPTQPLLTNPSHGFSAAASSRSKFSTGSSA
ncbi:hypothetical protein BOTBODRAFT_351536 [Botryobasidium botryosum FD-172 SS1]|uniref:Uncharacterized protein n=1 Tax=Botryobasidium botryosum (strain FD-172 SS1) TaxID=930990 RepID=A0A067MEZ3_BOTB1|nr:hypothetical protein BOTBODRAFT_351536 [Botryobasidium botryosum FD-172 SS1]